MIDLNNEINEYLTKRQEENKHELVIGKYSPSLLPMCLRRQYFEYIYPQEVSIEKQKIFEMGNVIHSKIAEILSKSKNIKVHIEERSLTLMNPAYDFIISGRLDNFIIMKEGGKNIIIEVKSAKALQTYDPETRTFNPMTEPKHDHVSQLNLYLYALPNSEGTLLYVNKNTLETKQFNVKPDKEMLNESFQRAQTLDTHLKTKTFPVAEAKMNPDTNWQCKYCEFVQSCDKMPKQAVKDIANPQRLADTTTEHF
jgi:CRISPR-associated exonuclease Cas4